ncbi:Phytoene desaturase [Chitinispirillum alkaliphilum]|nr:Phytoene desaturase [Chitinispirillum alkaliphilum]
MKKPHVIVIGAGPGGLTASMTLAHQGFRVSVFEKNKYVGGRNGRLRQGPYSFDIGPTFLMMHPILEQVFRDVQRDIHDYIKLTKLDPMYTLTFRDKTIRPSSDHQKMAQQIKALFPGNEKGFEKFLRREKLRFERMYPCLQKPYSSIGSYISKPFFKAIPHFAIGKTLFQILNGYFDDKTLCTAFTFQAKYLGMSPWQCPGAFAIIPFIEHHWGIHHTDGGLCTISEKMASVAEEFGAEFHLSTPVKKIRVRNKKAHGVILESGEVIDADAVVINADFGYAMENLFEQGVLRKYTPQKLRKKRWSCSTFMIYMGLNTLYDEPFHNIIFADDYKTNITEISRGEKISDDMSIYIRNASVIDKTLAPKGRSALYILVPVPNTLKTEKWDRQLILSYREKILKRVMDKTGMKDLTSRIVCEKIATPDDWEQKNSIFIGSTFNLGHNLSQMLHLRPHNRFEEVKNCYIVGGGTHPGSGLPTIYESGRISSRLVCKDFGVTPAYGIRH